MSLYAVLSSLYLVLIPLYLVLPSLYSVLFSLCSVQTLFGVFFIITGAKAIIFGAPFLIFVANAIIFGTSLFGYYFIIFGAYVPVNSKTAHPPRANPGAFDFFEKLWSNSLLCFRFRRSNAPPVRARKRVKSPTLQGKMNRLPLEINRMKMLVARSYFFINFYR